MIVLDPHIVFCADFADDFVVHGDDTGFQGTAELQVGLAVLQEQYVCGVAADVDDEQPQGLDHHAAAGHHCREGLGEYHHLVDEDGVGTVFVGEFHGAAPLEIGGKFFLQIKKRMPIFSDIMIFFVPDFCKYRTL